MKKLTLFAFTLFFISTAFAQMNAVIYSEAGEKFTLYLNGEAMNNAPQSNVKLQNLTSEFYQARVDFQDATLADFSNNNFALHPGMEVTYQIKKNKKGEYVLRYYTENPISGATANTPANNNVKDFAVADDVAPINNSTQTNNVGGTTNNSSTTTTTTVTGTNTKPANGGNVGMNINVDGVNMGLNVNVNETNTSTTGGNVGMNINVDGMNMGINMNVPNMDVQTSGTTTTTTTTTRTTSSSSTTNNSTVPAHTTRPSQPSNATIVGNGNCSHAMDQASFDKAKQTITNKGFDDTRLSTAKQVAKSNCLTTDQIVEIMKIFGFDDTRLDFAKYAYDFCLDQNNYFNVSEGFSFDSSTEELNKYIESK